ncbi:MAG: RNA polymerase sigma-70 factor [Bacteroidales bacterium]|jgi:RNA polymerase sigma-70 factor (ECF subfamily)|nr:RNA polymerase sigma-70 factor [Bacteroidales bacterium]
MLENEKILLEAIAKGDEGSFRRVFEHYYPKVRCFLGHFISSKDDAMDLAQNIFVKIWLHRELLPIIKSFEAYLYTMSRNAAIDYGRTNKVSIPLTDVSEKGNPYGTESEFFAKETEIQVAELIRRMPKKRRRIFILSRFEGKSNGEIAQELGISRKTVENHIYLALCELRKITKAIAIFL